jgi:hypothetical protein
MCPQWRDDFSAFAADMGPDPGPSFDIGRKDNDQGYFKENCVWETHKKNMRNTRRTLWVDFDGQTMSLAEACEIAGCKYKLTWARLKKGKTLVEAMR